MDIAFEIRSSAFIYSMLEKGINAEARAEAKGMRMMKVSYDIILTLMLFPPCVLI